MRLTEGFFEEDTLGEQISTTNSIQNTYIDLIRVLNVAIVALQEVLKAIN